MGPGATATRTSSASPAARCCSGSPSRGSGACGSTRSPRRRASRATARDGAGDRQRRAPRRARRPAPRLGRATARPRALPRLVRAHCRPARRRRRADGRGRGRHRHAEGDAAGRDRHRRPGDAVDRRGRRRAGAAVRRRRAREPRRRRRAAPPAAPDAAARRGAARAAAGRPAHPARAVRRAGRGAQLPPPAPRGLRRRRRPGRRRAAARRPAARRERRAPDAAVLPPGGRASPAAPRARDRPPRASRDARLFAVGRVHAAPARAPARGRAPPARRGAAAAARAADGVPLSRRPPALLSVVYADRDARMTRNIDRATVEGFGEEWRRFDQSELSDAERRETFEQYFAVFPWDALPEDAEGFDLGCGSGRWAALVAARVGRLHCVDASPEALAVARRTLDEQANCEFHVASVDALPFAERSMDFGYSLGVLHHVPDTAAALRSAVRPLKPGAPFLVYLYYAFDNRPAWYRALWRATDVVRRGISRSPVPVKVGLTSVIAALVYLPLARLGRALAARGRDVERVPLSFYRDRSSYTMRTDAFDRFATRLEQRFTADEVRSMMTTAGLRDVVVSSCAPYWCAVGRRAG